MKLFTIAAAAAMTAGAALATPVDVTGTPSGDSFTSFAGPGAGTHGLELRGGRPGARDWELGLGPATSQRGGFTQGEFAWDDATRDVGQFAFVYDYSAGTTTFSIWNALTGAQPTSPTLSFSGLSTGNAVEIFAKRDAAIRITEFDGHAVDYTIGDVTNSSSEARIFHGLGLTDGFTLAGTLDIKNDQGSRQSILIKAGNVLAPQDPTTPIPLPAALPLLAAGIGGLTLLRRRG